MVPLGSERRYLPLAVSVEHLGRYLGIATCGTFAYHTTLAISAAAVRVS